MAYLFGGWESWLLISIYLSFFWRYRTEYHFETQGSDSGDSNQDNARFVKQAKLNDGSGFI